MSERLFDPESPTGRCVHEFHKSLNDDRAARAVLRRANSLTEVVFVPAYHRFLHDFADAYAAQCGEAGQVWGDMRRLRLAAIAGLLSHVRTEERLTKAFRQTVAAQMARSKRETDAPVVSDLRFRRLLQADDVESLYPMLRRVLALMDGRIDPYLLADDLWHWGDRRRRQWAYDYYGELPRSQRAGAGAA